MVAHFFSHAAYLSACFLTGRFFQPNKPPGRNHYQLASAKPLPQYLVPTEIAQNPPRPWPAGTYLALKVSAADTPAGGQSMTAGGQKHAE
jgi:hypothetical protein